MGLSDVDEVEVLSDSLVQKESEAWGFSMLAEVYREGLPGGRRSQRRVWLPRAALQLRSPRLEDESHSLTLQEVLYA